MPTWVVLLGNPNGDNVVAVTHRLRPFLRRYTLPATSSACGWKAVDALAFPDPERAHAFRQRCGRRGSALRRVWRFACRTRAAKIFRGLLAADAELPLRLLPLFIYFASWRLSEPIKSQPLRSFTSAQRPWARLYLVERSLAVQTPLAKLQRAPILELA